MREVQLIEWFGEVPDLLITLYAPFVLKADATSILALIEHELYHCAEATENDGCPRYDSDGNRIYQMRGHDVEEFVGVVRRYGVGNRQHDTLREMIGAASHVPEVGQATIDGVCGTCLKVAI